MRWQTLREGMWILVVLAVLSAGGWWLHPGLGVVFLLLLLFTVSFFRDPNRETPAEPDLVVAPADGVVVEIAEIEETEWIKQRRLRVGIFLSVFNVHTNRAPIAGKVVYSKQHVGEFLDARNPESSRRNACRTWAFEGMSAVLVVRQITGAVARRIVAWSRVGDLVAKGERFGMIRFGSRTELYLPLDSEILTKLGDAVKGGETVIARLPKP